MSAGSQKTAVVVVGPYRSTGGMATVMRTQLSSHLNKRFHLVPFDSGKRTPPNRSLMRAVLVHLGMLWALHQLLKRHRPAILHVHTCSPPTFYRSWLDVLLGKLSGTRTILHIHGGRFCDDLQRLRPSRRWLATRVLRTADLVIVLGRAWRDEIHAFDQELEPAVVHNGVAVPEHDKRWRHTPLVRVVYVGDLKRAKGVDDLIDAYAGLPAPLRVSSQLRVIGPDQGGHLAELLERIREGGLQDEVLMLGCLPPDRVMTELRTADVFVLPSYHEGLPMALLEAMAHGLPCIAGSVGVIPEVVEDGVDGFLVRPGNVDQLKTALRTLLRSMDRRKCVGRAARRRVRRDLSETRFAEALEQLYDRMLPAKGCQVR